MSIAFYYGSGSPYGWRVWLALEHKQLAYDFKLLSFSAGDLGKPEFLALNPRGRVPVIVDAGFALYESAAIVEYLDDRYPDAGRPLFPNDIRTRALARRLVREADQYAANSMERMVDEILYKDSPAEWNMGALAAARKEFVDELARFESYLTNQPFFMGAAGAVDFTLYPLIALALRMERKKPDLGITPALGPKLKAWQRALQTLPYFAKTIPPHWKEN